MNIFRLYDDPIAGGKARSGGNVALIGRIQTCLWPSHDPRVVRKPLPKFGALNEESVLVQFEPCIHRSIHSDLARPIALPDPSLAAEGVPIESGSVAYVSRRHFLNCLRDRR